MRMTQVATSKSALSIAAKKPDKSDIGNPRLVTLADRVGSRTG
jgi:hypothetical protein